MQKRRSRVKGGFTTACQIQDTLSFQDLEDVDLVQQYVVMVVLDQTPLVANKKVKRKRLMRYVLFTWRKKKNLNSPGEDRTPDLRIPQHDTAYKYDALTD